MMNKDNLNDLNDIEFVECLHQVNEYFRKHPSVRVTMNLEPYKGPQCLEDRANKDRIDYLGDPLVYKYYDKRVFESELRCIDPALYFERASERQLEQALQNTSRTIFDSWAKRSVVDEYRGPQNAVHFTRKICSA